MAANAGGPGGKRSCAADTSTTFSFFSALHLAISSLADAIDSSKVLPTAVTSTPIHASPFSLGVKLVAGRPVLRVTSSSDSFVSNITKMWPGTSTNAVEIPALSSRDD